MERGGERENRIKMMNPSATKFNFFINPSGIDETAVKH